MPRPASSLDQNQVGWYWRTVSYSAETIFAEQDPPNNLTRSGNTWVPLHAGNTSSLGPRAAAGI